MCLQQVKFQISTTTFIPKTKIQTLSCTCIFLAYMSINKHLQTHIRIPDGYSDNAWAGHYIQPTSTRVYFQTSPDKGQNGRNKVSNSSITYIQTETGNSSAECYKVCHTNTSKPQDSVKTPLKYIHIIT